MTICHFSQTSRFVWCYYTGDHSKAHLERIDHQQKCICMPNWLTYIFSSCGVAVVFNRKTITEAALVFRFFISSSPSLYHFSPFWLKRHLCAAYVVSICIVVVVVFFLPLNWWNARNKYIEQSGSMVQNVLGLGALSFFYRSNIYTPCNCRLNNKLVQFNSWITITSTPCL